MKKKILFIIVAVVVIVGIFFIYISQTEKGLFDATVDKIASLTEKKEAGRSQKADDSRDQTAPSELSSGDGERDTETASQSETPSDRAHSDTKQDERRSDRGAGAAEGQQTDSSVQQGSATPSQQEAASPLVIDVNVLKNGKDGELSALMAERKKKWGLEKSVDIIAMGDEKIKVGDFELSLDTIEKDLKISEGRIVVEDLKDVRPSVRKTLTYFGVRLVRPGDNLWDIHFNILREYLAARGLKISPEADEPTGNGKSTGVGKVLKFAENMVMVFNLETRTPPTDLNILQPGAEVVIFNFTPIFHLLNSINFNEINRIQFDGKILTIEPA